jgi:hypothetical protein
VDCRFELHDCDCGRNRKSSASLLAELGLGGVDVKRKLR